MRAELIAQSVRASERNSVVAGSNSVPKVALEHVYMRPEVNSTSLRFHFGIKISLRCKFHFDQLTEMKYQIAVSFPWKQ